ncbi:MAG TPA: hypothetical protein VJI46_03610 [Candidatus Nanoarchaeia archaeon]|nr:hypothetical protein [Candidatus Nanoarchaeia archaeon]
MQRVELTAVVYLSIMIFIAFSAEAAYFSEEGHTRYYPITIVNQDTPSIGNLGVNISIVDTDCENDKGDIAIVYLNTTKKGWNFTNSNRDRVIFIANDVTFDLDVPNQDYWLYCNTTSFVSNPGAFFYANDFDDTLSDGWESTWYIPSTSAVRYNSEPYSLRWPTYDQKHAYLNIGTQGNDLYIDWYLNAPLGNDAQHCSFNLADSPDGLADTAFILTPWDGVGAFYTYSGGVLENSYFAPDNYLLDGQNSWNHFSYELNLVSGSGNITTNNNRKWPINITQGSTQYFRISAAANGKDCYVDNLYISTTPFIFLPHTVVNIPTLVNIGSCGDGIVQTPNGDGSNEECDDGNSNDMDGCKNDCTLPQSCGCTDECSEGQSGCLDEDTKWECVLRCDGCYHIQPLDCSSGQTCNGGLCNEVSQKVVFRTNVTNGNYNGCSSSSKCWIAVDVDSDGDLEALGYTTKYSSCQPGTTLTTTPEGYKVYSYSYTKSISICDTAARKRIVWSTSNTPPNVELSTLPTEPYKSNNQETYG